MIVEVYGRRLGSPIDSTVSVLDKAGRPVARAVLRPVDQTEMAFRDHPSSSSRIRLTRWNNLAINDYILFGREVGRILALPRNPDDDCSFWDQQGQRLGMLETTPEQHPMGQPMYKVEIHPPGTVFPPGGIPVKTLTYTNDDGGPSFGKDSRVTFDVPADGDYFVRVEDVRGLGGEEFGYHLVVRRPHPSFRVAVESGEPEHTSGRDHSGDPERQPDRRFRASDRGPGGGIAPGRHGDDRGDRERGAWWNAGSDGRGVGTGFLTAFLARRRSCSGRSGGEAIGCASRPGDRPGRTGWRMDHGHIPTEPGNRSAAGPGRNSSGPAIVDDVGGRQVPRIQGRVPIDVKNLPQGVRVLNIGLNGVLITEVETERTVSIIAEPWARPMVRSFFAVGKAESAGTAESSPPIELVVLPPSSQNVAKPSGR